MATMGTIKRDHGDRCVVLLLFVDDTIYVPQVKSEVIATNATTTENRVDERRLFLGAKIING